MNTQAAMHTQTTVSPGPFIKWAGGKTKLLPLLEPHLPDSLTSGYYEPFLGGGSVFFHMVATGRLRGCQRTVLSDTNGELVNAYIAVRDRPTDLLDTLSSHDEQHSKEFYYEMRSKEPADLDRLHRAARFIYLNRTCFNGLYRVNRAGKFNTPMGSYKNPGIARAGTILWASRALQGASILQCDFERTMGDMGEGDFAYIDPPYMPASPTANFTSYTATGFGRKDHERLEAVAWLAAHSGASWIVSNSDTPDVREIWKDYNVRTVQMPRRISAKGGGRGEVNEVLIVNRRAR